MKKIITIALLTVIILVSLSSCADESQDYSYTIRDALKISAWVLDESIEGDVDWVFDESAGQLFDTVDGVICDDIYVFERLKLNKIRMMAPLNRYEENLNIFVEFDGIIEAETEDEYIQLSYNSDNPAQPGKGKYEDIKVAYALYINVCPLGQYAPLSDRKHNVRSYARIGSEYYFNINAYKFDNEETPVIKAQLKLVVLEDKTKQPFSYGIGGEGDYSFDGISYKERSRFLSIELVSYQYSDKHILLDELWDEDDDD